MSVALPTLEEIRAALREEMRSIIREELERLLGPSPDTTPVRLRWIRVNPDVSECESCGWGPPRFGGRGVMHRHHIVPRSKGGSDADENLVWLCPNCHSLAHRVLYDESLPGAPPSTRENLLRRLELVYR